MAVISGGLLICGRILEANTALAGTLETTVEALRGRQLTDFLRPTHPADDNLLEVVFAGRRAHARGLRELLTVHGALVACQYTAALVETAPEEPVIVVSLSPLSLGQLRERERARRTSEALDGAPVGVALLDVHGRCVSANIAWTALGGIGAGSNASQSLMHENDDRVRTAVADATGGSERTVSLATRRPDGTRLIVEAHLVPCVSSLGVANGCDVFASEVQPGAYALDGADAEDADVGGDVVGLGVVAETLDVSTSTIRRWIDDGLLQATRTTGGHRRVARSEMRRVARTIARAPRVRRAALPVTTLPGLSGVLQEFGSELTCQASRLTYDPGAPGWFATPRAIAVLEAMLESVAVAVNAGSSSDALDAASSTFATARNVASLEECLKFADTITALILRQLQGAPGGPPELADARVILAAMRRTVVVLEDGRG